MIGALHRGFLQEFTWRSVHLPRAHKDHSLAKFLKPFIFFKKKLQPQQKVATINKNHFNITCELSIPHP
jgi:hypothetical protein